MKSWRRTLAIGFIIAITSQLYWNVFVNNFRVSASVILLPVLIMTVGSQIHTMTICTVTSILSRHRCLHNSAPDGAPASSEPSS